MASPEQLEVHRALRDSQSKYTYFLLASAGAAVGFALNQTKESVLAVSQVPLGIAVLLWGVSFYFGCRYIQYVNSYLYANAELLLIESGQHSAVGSHPERIAESSGGTRNAMESKSDFANELSKLQFTTLVAGAAFYILWHVIEMFLRS